MAATSGRDGVGCPKRQNAFGRRNLRHVLLAIDLDTQRRGAVFGTSWPAPMAYAN